MQIWGSTKAVNGAWQNDTGMPTTSVPASRNLTQHKKGGAIGTEKEGGTHHGT